MSPALKKLMLASHAVWVSVDHPDWRCCVAAVLFPKGFQKLSMDGRVGSNNVATFECFVS